MKLTKSTTPWEMVAEDEEINRRWTQMDADKKK
jgi:hypothetical protein